MMHDMLPARPPTGASDLEITKFSLDSEGVEYHIDEVADLGIYRIIVGQASFMFVFNKDDESMKGIRVRNIYYKTVDY